MMPLKNAVPLISKSDTMFVSLVETHCMLYIQQDSKLHS